MVFDAFVKILMSKKKRWHRGANVRDMNVDRY